MSTLQKINEHLKEFSEEELLIKRWDIKPTSEAIHQAMYRKYPLNEKYFFELNPSFVYEYPSIEAMLTFPFIMLRDGFLGLYYFFLKNPVLPKKSETIFLIPSKFSEIIPKSWKDNVLLYSFKYTNENLENSKWMYYGNISREIYFKKKLKDYIIPKNKDYYFLSPLQSIGYHPSHSELELYMNFQNLLLEISNFKAKIINTFREDELNFIDKTFTCENVDKNNFLIYDDYLTHFFASKGASIKVINTKNEKMKTIKTIKLSQYHEIQIGELKDFSNKILEEKIDLKLKSVPISLSSHLFYNQASSYFLKNY